ncbi:hypothetical protein U9M48_033553 [Paspalum notatum var. saurae]|uniref:Uncharacterized protein n=1 Tax=Paspalum notatum var. saurae TaxID=547442 RepID=A0AAQ3UA11_PASNO
MVAVRRGLAMGDWVIRAPLASAVYPPGPGRHSAGSVQRTARYGQPKHTGALSFMYTGRVALHHAQSSVYVRLLNLIQFIITPPKSKRPAR